MPTLPSFVNVLLRTGMREGNKGMKVEQEETITLFSVSRPKDQKSLRSKKVLPAKWHRVKSTYESHSFLHINNEVAVKEARKKTFHS